MSSVSMLVHCNCCRPDMKMLEVGEFALLEIHEHCERRLGLDEKPLLVQLNWHREDRDGRFLLRSLTPELSVVNHLKTDQKNFRRSLSVRMKKVFSKQEKPRKHSDEVDNKHLDKVNNSPALKRSLTNPDSVLERRRLNKPMPSPSPLLLKNHEDTVKTTFENSDQHEEAILVKIQSELPNKNVPLMVVRLGPGDSCDQVLGHLTLKYGLPPHLVKEYCLVYQHGVQEQHLLDHDTPYSHIVSKREGVLILRRRHNMNNYTDHDSVMSFDSSQVPRHLHHHLHHQYLHHPHHHGAMHHQQQPPLHEFDKEEILPAVLEFSDETEDELFSAIITHLDPTLVNFKLAPAYILYMSTRFRASTLYRPELVPEIRAMKLTEMLIKISRMMR